jgi:hypothetical protein
MESGELSFEDGKEPPDYETFMRTTNHDNCSKMLAK